MCKACYKRYYSNSAAKDPISRLETKKAVSDTETAFLRSARNWVLNEPFYRRFEKIGID